MIAAIVLRGSKAWFLKGFGPKDQVDSSADDVLAFFESVELPEGKPNAIAWKTPEGWQEGAAQPMREATLLVPSEGEPLELAISTLAYDGNAKRTLLANINRWRGQLQLPPVKELNEAGGVTQMKVEGGWLFDAVGEMGAGGRMPPFASGAAPPPKAAPPKTTPPVAAAHVEPQLDSKLPAGWTEQPPRAMIRQVFAAGKGDDAVRIELSEFPAGAPMISDPLENVNRWRGQVGLEAVAKDELTDVTEAVQIGDDEGLLAEMISEDGAKGILAAMVEKYDRVWFFKMIGTKAGIEAHREELRDWLQGVHITLPTSSEEDE